MSGIVAVRGGKIQQLRGVAQLVERSDGVREVFAGSSPVTPTGGLLA